MVVGHKVSTNGLRRECLCGMGGYGLLYCGARLSPWDDLRSTRRGDGGNKTRALKQTTIPSPWGHVERARAWRQLLAPLVVNVRRETLVRLSPCTCERIGHGRSNGAASHGCAGHGIVFSPCSRQELCRQLTVDSCGRARDGYISLSRTKNSEALPGRGATWASAPDGATRARVPAS